IKTKLRLATCLLAKNRQAAVKAVEEVVALLVASSSQKHVAHWELRRFPALMRAVHILPEMAPLRSCLELQEPTRPQKQPDSGSLSLSTSPASPIIKLLGFGEPTVMLNEKPVTAWCTRRARELCFFLLEASSPLSKEQIIANLWEDEE